MEHIQYCSSRVGAEKGMSFVATAYPLLRLGGVSRLAAHGQDLENWWRLLSAASTCDSHHDVAMCGEAVGKTEVVGHNGGKR